jgi:GNAT superfamily N-acetyltransferase
MRAFYRLLASGSAGAHLVEADGVLAAVVPAAPLRSYPNAVLYRDASALERAYDELETAYGRAGVRAWTVWVPEGDREAVALLERRGHRLDATPTAMGARLEELALDGPEPAGDWTAEGDIADVGRLNDAAYGYEDTFVRVFGDIAGTAVRRYVAHEDGEPAACVLTTLHEGNCEVDGVATTPRARGRGLASALMRQALRDALDAGCETTTLIATAAGRPLSDRLGYRALGRVEMWERRED